MKDRITLTIDRKTCKEFRKLFVKKRGDLSGRIEEIMKQLIQKEKENRVIAIRWNKIQHKLNLNKTRRNKT